MRKEELIVRCDGTGCGARTNDPFRDRWITVCIEYATDDTTQCGGPIFDACSRKCAADIAEHKALGEHPEDHNKRLYGYRDKEKRS